MGRAAFPTARPGQSRCPSIHQLGTLPFGPFCGLADIGWSTSSLLRYGHGVFNLFLTAMRSRMLILPSGIPEFHVGKDVVAAAGWLVQPGLSANECHGHSGPYWFSCLRRTSP